MGKRISEDGKVKEGRGLGTGASYKPWIKIRELNSSGTASSFPDWKHGRMVDLLSQAELWAYLTIRWNDSVTDIREQYPIDLATTNSIARRLGFRPAGNGRTRMTTDLLVSMEDGKTVAVSAKAERKDLEEKKKKMELLAIEYEYWKSYGIPWQIMFKEDLNPIEIRNIRDAVSCYDIRKVTDEFSFVRHLIARKIITVDMTQPIDYREIIEKLKGDEDGGNTPLCGTQTHQQRRLWMEDILHRELPLPDDPDRCQQPQHHHEDHV